MCDIGKRVEDFIQNIDLNDDWMNRGTYESIKATVALYKEYGIDYDPKPLIKLHAKYQEWQSQQNNSSQ